MPQERSILLGRRARLRPLEVSDAGAIQARFPQWEVVRYLSDSVPWPYPPTGAVSHLTRSALPAMEAGTEHHWAVERVEVPGQLLGVVSLLPLAKENQRGFWIDPREQGLGLGLDAAELVTGFAFERLDMERLELANAEPNVPSIRIKERQGARYVRSVPGRFVAGSFGMQIWQLSRQDWLTTRRHL